MNSKKQLYEILTVVVTFWIFSGLWLTVKLEKSLIVPLTLLFIVGVLSGKGRFWLNRIKNSKFIQVLLALVLVINLYDISVGGLENYTVRGYNSAFLLVLFLEKISLDKIINIIFLSLFLHLTYVVWFIFTQDGYRPDYIMNPNVYSGFFGLVYVFSFSMLLFSKDRGRSTAIKLLTCFSISIACLVLISSRNAMLSSLVSTLLLISIYLFTIKGSQSKTLFYVFSILIVLGVSIVVFGDSINILIARTQHEIERLARGDLNTSIGYRLQMYLIAIDMIKEKWLLGWGDSYQAYLNQALNAQEIPRGLYIQINRHFHNSYLDTWIKIGVFPILVCVFFIFYGVRKLIPVKDEYSAAIIGVFCFSLIASLFDSTLQRGVTVITLSTICTYMSLLRDDSIDAKGK